MIFYNCLQGIKLDVFCDISDNKKSNRIKRSNAHKMVVYSFFYWQELYEKQIPTCQPNMKGGSSWTDKI